MPSSMALLPWEEPGWFDRVESWVEIELVAVLERHDGNTYIRPRLLDQCQREVTGQWS
jgi:hypothetical protein